MQAILPTKDPLVPLMGDEWTSIPWGGDGAIELLPPFGIKYLPAEFPNVLW